MVEHADKVTIQTDAAPQAIGTYSQAVVTQGSKTTYLSGQIPLVPSTMEVVGDGFAEQAHQVFRNLSAVAEAAGGSLAQLAKLTIYLTDLANFTELNEIMSEYFTEPYPARAAVQVSALPKGVAIEIDAIMTS